MELWRISNHPTLNGEGGRRSSARWHRAGQPVVYLAESPPGALLEMLVHYSLADGVLPEPYTLLRVRVEGELAVADLKPPRGKWTRNTQGTRDAGDRWLAARQTALARVPSAIMPHTFNVLLNPLHKGAPRVRIAHAEEVEFDLRLLRLPSSGRLN